MKLRFKRFNTLKWTAIVLGVIALEAWDMSHNNVETEIDGSFRADSLFDFTPAPATTVAVVASDNINLPSPIALNSNAITMNQVEAMVKRAIDLVGGIDKYVQSGDTVIIKPNIVGANKPNADGENTDVRVVKSIIRIIYQKYGNACKIYIGEGSARSIATFGGKLFGNTQYAYSLLSADHDLSGINFELLDLNDGEVGTSCVYAKTKASLSEPQKGSYWIHKYLVSPNVKFINVPVLKMHEPGITCCLKNQIGIAAGAYYGYNKTKKGSLGNYFLIHHNLFNAANNYKTWQDEEITDLCSCIDHFDLNVVDALMCLETQKTLMSNNANQVRLNTILAGPDPVAVDHVCLRIIGANPDDVAHVTMADKIGLGTNNTDSINILGENISTKYNYRFKRGSIHSQYGQGNRVWLVSPAYTFTSMSSNYIASEASLNPQKGDKPWSAPIYFFDDRIDLNSYQGVTGNVVTYCFTNVYSPEAKSDVELWLNSEEDMMVYLNGANVYNYSGSRANSDIVTDKPKINLLQGENRILVKVLQKVGNYDFSLNICEPNTDGNRVEGIKFYIKNYNEPAALKTNTSLQSPTVASNLKIIQTANKLQIDDANVVKLTIYNVKGNIMANSNSDYINISNLNKGVYIVSVGMKNGSTINKKFIK